MTEISKNIRKYRRLRGMSQEDLAARLHVTRQTVSSWERARSYPDLDMVVALSRALQTDPNSLLYPPVKKGGAPRGVSPKPILITLLVFYLLITRGGLLGEWWIPFGLLNAGWESHLIPIYCGIVALAVLVVGCTIVLLEELRGQNPPAAPEDAEPQRQPPQSPAQG